MAPVTRNAKKARISVSKPKRAGSGSMVVLAPAKTRRGKTIHTEVDAAPYYAPSDKKDESPKRKPPHTPSRSGTTALASLEDTQGFSFLDNHESHEPRITKVRSKL
jgi:hypothetical protein